MKKVWIEPVLVVMSLSLNVIGPIFDGYSNTAIS
jgi:hypothetical protein